MSFFSAGPVFRRGLFFPESGPEKHYRGNTVRKKRKMILRSAVQLQAKVIASVSTGDFIELRSDDHSAKPWLARVVGTRSSPDQLDSGIVPTEVECEWLWHPKETIAELGLVGVDPNVYGSREVFLGSGNGEATRDWNPIESKKWQVYVFPLVQYKAVAAAGFQLVAHDDSDRRYGPTVSGSKAVILDPSRCWYYRQAVDTDKRTLFPDLERTIHCPNPAFLQWCRLANTKPDQPTPLHLPPDATDPPPRTLCVPENPECVYFFCTDCSRRFETRQGDCVDSAAPFFLEDARPTIRFKSHINQADVAFRCPMCVTAASAVSFQTDRPESSGAHSSLLTRYVSSYPINSLSLSLSYSRPGAKRASGCAGNVSISLAQNMHTIQLCCDVCVCVCV